MLNYRLSHLTTDEKFITLSEGSVAPPCPYPFTKSEKDVLKRLAEGKSMAAIAHDNHISLATLKKHRGNILRKTGDKKMVSLLKDCLQNDWLEN